MRQPNSCPDLGLAKEPGLELPIDGSQAEFPDCPAAYLRTAQDVAMLADRWGGRTPFAEHLIDGVTHPATIISAYAAEVESGARSVDSISPRALALVHLWRHETQSKHDYERKQQRKDK